MSHAESPSRPAGYVAFLAILVGLLCLPELAQVASATVVTSVSNIPSSGISPGGVDMASGELILVMRPDLALDGPMPVVFGRYYASMLAREGFASGRLGPNWLGSYDWSLSVTGPTGQNVTVVTNRGERIQFLRNPVGAYDLVQPTYEKYRLASVGGVWRFTDPLRRRIYRFDGTSRLLTQVLDEHGNALSLSYAVGGGPLSQVSDGMGRSLTFGYNSSGLLASVSDGTRSVTYSYTGGILTSATDAGVHTWTYAYATPAPVQGLLTGVTEPLGNTPVTHAYDALGRVASQMDAAGGTATYTYDTPTGSVFSDPLGNPWTYLHDAQNRLSSLTDPALGVTSYGYDSLGRLISMTRPMLDVTSLSYDAASGYPSALIRADTTPISWGYGSHLVGGATLFDVATASYPDGTNETYGRDAAGNLTNFLDRGGFPWTGTYNTRGQLLTSTNPSSGVTTFTYDSQGRPASGKDNAGNTTTYTFDPLSRLTQLAHHDLSTQSFVYDALNHVTTFTDERGKAWTYDYDADGRLTSATDPLLHATQFEYDGLDRVTHEIDPLGHAAVYAYDLDGRLASETDRTDRVTTYAHDAWGNTTGVTPPGTGTYSFGYDANRRMTSEQDPLGHAVVIGHDLLDRVTHVTDPVATEFDYGYDSMGRLISSSGPPIEAPASFSYDPRGLLTLAHKSTVEVGLAHTRLGEVSELTDPNHNPWPSSYDPQGRRTSAADPLGRTTSYQYDSRSRLAQATLPLGSVNFTYDPTGDAFLECQWLDGTTLTYTYDDARRLTSATGASFAYDAAGRVTGSNGLTMTYDNEGRMTSITYAPGKVVTYAYDTRGLLAGVSDWIGGTTTFAYDDACRLSTITRPPPQGLVTTYEYDNADRLIHSVEKQPGPTQTPLSSITVARDALGRPASIERSQPLMPAVTSPSTTSFTYDAASQTEGLTWDPMGRLVTDGTRTFEWDGASRLTHYTAGAESPSFTYDAFGRMLSRTQGAKSESYVWNYASGTPTLVTKNPGPTEAIYYVYTPSGHLLYSVSGSPSVRRYYHYDTMGNTICLTNDAGSVVAEYAYTSEWTVTGLGETGGNDFTLGSASGLFQLGSSGLFSDGTTIYDAVTRRRISQRGTFMHELGHTFGLHHGGATDVATGSVWQINSPHFGGATDVATGSVWQINSPNFGGKHHFGHRYELFGHSTTTDPGPSSLSVMNHRYQTAGIAHRSDPGGDGLGDSWEGEHPVDINCDNCSSDDGRISSYPDWFSTSGTEPCHFCPNGPVLTKPMFSEVSKITVAAMRSLTANEPSLNHPGPSRWDPTATYLEPNLLDIRLYGEFWLSEVTKQYWEEQHHTRPDLPPPDHPGLGDPMKPWKPRPILIWLFTDPPTGTNPFDPRSLTDYVMPLMTPCYPCQ